MNLIPYNKKKNTNLLGIKIIHPEAGCRKSVKFTVTVKCVGIQRVKVNCKVVLAPIFYFRLLEKHRRLVFTRLRFVKYIVISSKS